MPWPAANYEQWRETCDTLHAHAQVLGKLAVALAPPEPQLQHAALRLTARGWETAPLPAPDGSGALVALLDLRTHEAVVEHSAGRSAAVPLSPDRPVGEVTRDVLAAVGELGGPVQIDPTPQEVSWTRAARRGRRARALRRRPRSPTTSPRPPGRRWCWPPSGRPTAAARRRSTPGGARSTWPSACSRARRPTRRPTDFIMRNAMDAQEVAVGWWPGDARYGRAAFYAYAHPAPDGFGDAPLTPPAARWDASLGRVHPGLGRRRAADPPRPRWSSPGRRSGTPARSASGTRPWPPAPTRSRRRCPDALS